MYDQYYELSGRPFQLTPDPRFYFESGTHRKALSYLGYGLAQGEGFIVITGEIGAGKTTLVRHLMETVDPGRLTAANIVTTQLEGGDLLHMVAEAFGVAVAGDAKSDALSAIEQFLHAEARQGRRCLLVVDEAQNLPTATLEELRMLSNFQLGNQALLQIFLLGQPEFRDQLKTDPGLEQLRQRVIATHHLEAMQPEEMEPYILHRLGKVGWNGRPDFTMEAIDKLYEASGGVPRKLNSLMTRVLLMGAVEKIDRIEVGLIEDVLADIEGDREVPVQIAVPATPAEASDAEDTQADGPEQKLQATPDTAEPEPAPMMTEATAEMAAVEEDEAEAEVAPMENISDSIVIEEDEPDAKPEDEQAEESRPVIHGFFRPGTTPPVFETVPDSAPHSEAPDDDRVAELAEQIDRLEERIDSQEATIKRLVAMLLDHVERGDELTARRAA
ncbi:MAG: general secretion pathway protein [Sphingorhabdus sp.]|nr:general secretion pathway protein [Sphingorhabdus sp.]